MPAKKPVKKPADSKEITLESLQAEINSLAEAVAANTHDIMGLQTEMDELKETVKRLDNEIKAGQEAFKVLVAQIFDLKTPAGFKIDEIHQLLISGTPEEWIAWREAKENEIKAAAENA